MTRAWMAYFKAQSKQSQDLMARLSAAGFEVEEVGFIVL
jgi:hypothetical protein